jgi:DNA-binding NarL/FixJ family response regulator
MPALFSSLPAPAFNLIAFTFPPGSEALFLAHIPGDESVTEKRKRVRILIADDHEAVRRGLRSALTGAGWEICGEASNGKEAIAKTLELQPDLILLDVSMPQMGGLEAAPKILSSAPGVKVVVFTMHESQQIKNEMVNMGVHGLAIKSAPLGNLLDTIKRVLAK